MVTREEVAAAYRECNVWNRPWYESDRATWDTLTAEEVTVWLLKSLDAVKLDRAWRKQTGSITCVYGAKGCPPYALRRCEGLHAGETLDTRLTRTTGARPETPQSGKPDAKQASLDMGGSGL